MLILQKKKECMNIYGHISYMMFMYMFMNIYVCYTYLYIFMYEKLFTGNYFPEKSIILYLITCPQYIFDRYEQIKRSANFFAFFYAFSRLDLIKYLHDFSRLDVSVGSSRLLYLGICGSA